MKKSLLFVAALSFIMSPWAMDSTAEPTKVGAWKGHLPGNLEIAVTILRDADSSFRAVLTFKDGSTLEEDLELKGGRYVVADSRSGEYYRVLPDGDLEVADQDGALTVLRRRQ